MLSLSEARENLANLLSLYFLKLAMRSGVRVVEISTSEEEDTIKSKSKRSLKRSWDSNPAKDSDDDVLIIEKPSFIAQWGRKKRLKGGKGVKASDDDCIILDGDPEKIDFRAETRVHGSKDLVVTAERGPVACRDYPHPRHLCAKFSFRSTPHEKHCELCHCYICEKRAPCSRWTKGHCHASDKEERWKNLRCAYRLAHSLSGPKSH